MIIAIIPAKADSRRIPNKNMALLNGKPIIYYSIKIAKESKLIDKIYVSTDSEEIVEYARKEGINVIERGQDLAGDTPVIEVYHHAISKLDKNITYIVGLQPDHPDRTVNIDEVIKFAIEKKYDDIFTVDCFGKRNGSIRIMNAEALRKKRLHVNIGSFMDNCTNIHTIDDLKVAESNIIKN